MDLEFGLNIMNFIIKVIFKITKAKEKELKSYLMFNQYIMEIIIKIIKMDMESLNIKIKINITAIGKMDFIMVKEDSNFLMVVNIKENSKNLYFMEMEY